MNMFARKFKLTLGLVVMIASCNFHEERDVKPPGSSDGTAASAFGFLAEKLFNKQCAGCHNPGRSAGGVDLTSFDSIVNGSTSKGKPLVVAGDVSVSFIHGVIKSGRMPPRGKVSSDLLSVLTCWIEQGAPELGASTCIPVEPTNPPEPDGLRFAQIYNKVLEPNCTQCHSGEEAAEGVDFSNLEAFKDVKAVLGEDSTKPAEAVLISGDPEASLLWRAINSDWMPYFASPLSQEDKDLIHKWIEEGARQ